MKTKAEALANPAAGDIWVKTRTRNYNDGRRGGSGLTREYRRVNFSAGVYIGYAAGARKRREQTATVKSFRRWAAGAEYLGNEGNNA